MGMAVLAAVAVGGQLPGLIALTGFSDERAQWDARSATRDELALELRQLEQTIESTRIEAEGLTPILSGRQAELAALREALGEAEASREDAFAQRAAALAKLASAEAGATESETRKAEADKSRAALQVEIATLGGKQEALRGSIAELTAEAAGLEQRRQEKDRAQQRLSEVQTQILDAQARLEAYGVDLAEKSERVSQAQELLAEQARLSTEVGRLATDRDRAAEQQTDLQARVADLERRKNELLTLRTELEQETQQVGDHRRMLLQEVATLEGRKQALANEIGHYQEQLLAASNLESTIARLQTEERGMSSTVQARRSELETVQKDLVGLQREATQLEQTVATASKLQIDVGSLRSQVDSLNQQRGVLEVEIKRLQADEQSLRDATANAMAAYTARFKELTKAIESALDSLSRANKPPDGSTGSAQGAKEGAAQ